MCVIDIKNKKYNALLRRVAIYKKIIESLESSEEIFYLQMGIIYWLRAVAENLLDDAEINGGKDKRRNVEDELRQSVIYYDLVFDIRRVDFHRNSFEYRKNTECTEVFSAGLTKGRPAMIKSTVSKPGDAAGIIFDGTKMSPIRIGDGTNSGRNLQRQKNTEFFDEKSSSWADLGNVIESYEVSMRIFLGKDS